MASFESKTHLVKTRISFALLRIVENIYPVTIFFNYDHIPNNN